METYILSLLLYSAGRVELPLASLLEGGGDGVASEGSPSWASCMAIPPRGLAPKLRLFQSGEFLLPDFHAVNSLASF